MRNFGSQIEVLSGPQFTFSKSAHFDGKLFVFHEAISAHQVALRLSPKHYFEGPGPSISRLSTAPESATFHTF